MALSRWSRKRNSDDAFSRNGGKLSHAQLIAHIREMEIDSWEQKHRIKEVMKKFGDPAYAKGITQADFHQGLEDLASDIDPTYLDEINEHF
jgi:hypothetical protein